MALSLTSSPLVRKITIGSLIVIMAASNGCQVAPSKTRSGAGPGAGAGAGGGGLAGSASGTT
ncbi:MAG: hypothetical protein PSW75_04060, partial [bacterium]|nr:hypothetical protein [bacterium]